MPILDRWIWLIVFSLVSILVSGAYGLAAERVHPPLIFSGVFTQI